MFDGMLAKHNWSYSVLQIEIVKQNPRSYCTYQLYIEELGYYTSTHALQRWRDTSGRICIRMSKFSKVQTVILIWKQLVDPN